VNLQQILKQGALESSGHKRKWQKKKGIRQWNDHIKKVIRSLQEIFISR
jgi:hypothetical protein